MLKRVLARVGAEMLFWMGHVTSRMLVPLSGMVFYPVYNTLMCWSIWVQDWGGADGPWSVPEPMEEENDC